MKSRSFHIDDTFFSPLLPFPPHIPTAFFFFVFTAASTNFPLFCSSFHQFLAFSLKKWTNFLLFPLHFQQKKKAFFFRLIQILDQICLFFFFRFFSLLKIFHFSFPIYSNFRHRCCCYRCCLAVKTISSRKKKTKVGGKESSFNLSSQWGIFIYQKKKKKKIGKCINKNCLLKINL